MNEKNIEESPLKQRLRSIIFGTDTPEGKAFDIALLVSIVASILLICLDTIDSLHNNYGELFLIGEWMFTIIFTLEYVLRLYCSQNRFHYARSFFGVVDLLSIIPTYLALIFPAANFALAIRVLRLFRVFRVLKLLRFLADGNLLLKAMLQSSRKVFMFFFSVSLIILVLSVVMYVIEGPNNGFSSIPKSMYWTIVTITTVGYGDITPQTPLGQAIAALTMLIGYSIIAIPTGILTAEISHEMVKVRDLRKCSNCGKKGHDNDAQFCNHCGSDLETLDSLTNP
ncbi:MULTISPECIES: ion transporter [Pseudomonadati]|uniref:Ion transporter n=1 Tax=Shewanella aestuarii TaxID=1028752 RepID=A0ABT0L5K2_9GAMM|nr:ion transporter [Shewanella aestuarii]MCL1118700.1 ion transporter [Shewanella aestuarii]GGN67791.1 ion transporter [Shewanella aestuarii]